MPVSKNKRQKTTGQRKHAGRFDVYTNVGALEGRAIKWAGITLGWVGLVLGVMCLSASTLDDSAQKTALGQVNSAQIAQAIERSVEGDVSGKVAMQRQALLRYVSGRAGAVRTLHPSETILLFGRPSLERNEGDLRVWQFASGECALDMYYRGKKRPVYAEYRVRGSAERRGAVKAAYGFSHDQCVRSLFMNSSNSVR